MMRARRNAVFLIAMAVGLCGGCATLRVRVNAYRSADLPFPSAEAKSSATVAVVVGSEPEEPLLEAEVGRKVESLVRAAGFQIGEVESADYLLTAWVSLNEGVTETMWDIRADQARYGSTLVYSGGGYWSGVSLTVPANVYETPYEYAYYSRFLGLTLYDRARWAAADDVAKGRAAVWTCTATSVGSSSDIRTLVNYLLAGAFDRFGVDTYREITFKFKKDDPQVARIDRMGRARSTGQASTGQASAGNESAVHETTGRETTDHESAEPIPQVPPAHSGDESR
jgi:hypothetical protein